MSNEIPRYSLRATEVHAHLAEHGLMVADLARDLLVTPSAAYRWFERGRRLGPRLRQRLMRSKVLDGMDFEDMFERVD